MCFYKKVLVRKSLNFIKNKSLACCETSQTFFVYVKELCYFCAQIQF